MIDGRISLGAGSTVPTLEAGNIKLEPIPKAAAEEKEPESDIMVKQEPDNEPEMVDIEPLPIIRTTTIDQPRSIPGSLFVGDLRLAQLKARLNTSGIAAEFAGEGVLICGPGVAARSADPEADIKSGSIVAVRKMGEGEIVVEGSVGKVYFAVRKEVYGSLALVAAA